MQINKFITSLLRSRLTVLLAVIFSGLSGARAQTGDAAAFSSSNVTTATLQIDAGRVTAKVSPMLYGLMTEEINYSYEGGLYGELIRNRSFKANKTSAAFWKTTGNAMIDLDASQPLNDALNVSLKFEPTSVAKDAPAGIVNRGYWGIPVKPKTTYHASFYAKAAGASAGPLTVSLRSDDGSNTFASAEVSGITTEWKKYEVTLKTKNAEASKNNEFVISTTSPGTIWFDEVSLFGPTYKDRANGNRPDIIELLAAMSPKFLRLPGGNYLEGNEISNRFNWKATIGDVTQRPGHMDDGWGYWSTDGLGFLEYLEWCEDLHMEPLVAVYAGYSMHQRHVEGEALQPFIQDALDEIEYVIGDTGTKWGAERAKDGHPAPFPLHYVEVGNEDFADHSGSYDQRFTQLYDAIKAKYPLIQVIATTKVKTRTPDLYDEHYYRSEEDMELHAHDYDKRERTGPKIFVGEWATRVGYPTPNMAGALGDAAWMTGMERNSDLVVMSSYAPLFVNVSDLNRGGSMQWRSDLIGYDALTSYGSPSYYAQQMFSTHHGDEVLATDSRDIATYSWAPRGRNGQVGQEQSIPTLFFDATRDSGSGTIYLKVVNRLGMPRQVNVEINGAKSVSSKGAAIVLKGKSPNDTNSIKEPTNIVPVEEKVSGLGEKFTREIPAYSITVLELKAK